MAQYGWSKAQKGVREVKGQIQLTILKARGSSKPPRLSLTAFRGSGFQAPLVTSIVSPIFSTPETLKPSSREWEHLAGVRVQDEWGVGSHLEEDGRPLLKIWSEKGVSVWFQSKVGGQMPNLL